MTNFSKLVVDSSTLPNVQHSGTRLLSTSLKCSNQSLNGEKFERVIRNNEFFGRLSKCGRTYLANRGGWRQLTSDNDFEHGRETILHFVWPNKSGPQFHDLTTLEPAKVRPFPIRITNILDDKILLNDLLAGTNVMPKSVNVPEQADPNQLYFVKHRHGAQGKSVYAYHRNALLMTWWNDSSKKKNVQDFLIQEEIPPALDSKGRKFALRSHLLLFYRHGEQLQALLHRDVTCQSHSMPYDRSSLAKAAHVSQAGKHHPKPQLLEELDEDHPAKHCFEQLLDSCKVLISKLRTATTSLDATHPDVTLFALAGADHLIDSNGETKLCEINSHPALGWGSMKNVDHGVYKRLIEETLAIVVFGDDYAATSFVPIR
eukprot:CAMPEP_0178926512 /NCGR_PEP_ID=MMETSP0786-20121207/18581_1 /TAXON_ID=186022 /ORGANISM="Thalassionema frauenfeldii, Strain CCMP 1798" /LENGTH=372 /DNA_ID=CAMNT_0020601657 /DNA_START=67 /DNA_END=1185 /DNA_ORIENTATION=-